VQQQVNAHTRKASGLSLATLLVALHPPANPGW
jgi:hypothetical protein